MTSIPLVQTRPDHGPIACTLSSEEYRDRIGALSALSARALIGREPIAGGQRLTFAAAPEAERELRAVVAAESACCAFLGMDLRRDDDAQVLVLDVTGPDDAQPVIAELFA